MNMPVLVTGMFPFWTERSVTPTMYHLRHPANSHELTALLRYRAEAMQRAGLQPVMGSLHQGMEYDAYDLRSEHYGVYHGTTGQERLVGCVRIIGDADSQGHMADALRELVPVAELQAAPLLPFLGLSFKQGRPELPLDRAVEVGRMMTDAHLGTAFIGLLNALYAVGFLLRGHRHAYVACGERLARLYQRFGFADHGEVDIPLAHRSRVVGLHRMAADERLLGMAAEFERTGRIMFA